MSTLVTGATSLVGRFLLPRLLEAGHVVHAVSRNPPPGPDRPGLAWHRVDLGQGLGLDALGLSGLATFIHVAPLWLLPPLVAPAAARGARRLIAFGSTSVFTKASSASPKERDVVRRLAEAEELLQARCHDHGVTWTLFRPTLIYGAGLDRNVSDIARFIRRFGFFPLAGRGEGLRQPVHADDLAAACVSALASPAARGRAYNLGGGSTLRYVEMVQAVFAGLGRRSRIVQLPLPVMRGLLRLASRVPGYGHLTPAMADRMDEDLCFDPTGAEQDLGWQPRPFRYEPDAAPVS